MVKKTTSNVVDWKTYKAKVKVYLRFIHKFFTLSLSFYSIKALVISIFNRNTKTKQFW